MPSSKEVVMSAKLELDPVCFWGGLGRKKLMNQIRGNTCNRRYCPIEFLAIINIQPKTHTDGDGVTHSIIYYLTTASTILYVGSKHHTAHSHILAHGIILSLIRI